MSIFRRLFRSEEDVHDALHWQQLAEERDRENDDLRSQLHAERVMRDKAETELAQVKTRLWEKEKALRAEIEEANARTAGRDELLRRARELLIHQKVDSQLRDPRGMSGSRPGMAAANYGWRCSGIAELHEAIDQELRK